jgi:6-hydroxycyclohex-1-ene-1-carbonyl-CoA dehydrogenase
MRAALLRAPRTPLELTEVPRPEPGAGEVRLAVAGCGFCGTDLHYLDEGVPTAKPLPIILGHEISGTVEAVGPGVPPATVGQRAILPAVLPCGACAWCRSGRENICPKMRMFGNHIDGGFAESVIAPARELIPLPEEIDLVRACVIADALSTPYHAVVHRAKVRPGETVAVVGCGGVGINAVQFAVRAGGTVIAVDVNDRKLELARRLGARATLNPRAEGEEGLRRVRKEYDGGVDVAIEAVGSPATFGTALALLRRGARLCMIGYAAAPVALPVSKLMFFEYSLVGSLGCRPVDYPRVVEMVRTGQIRIDPVVTGTVPLARIAEAAQALRDGEGLRTVVTP